MTGFGRNILWLTLIAALLWLYPSGALAQESLNPPAERSKNSFIPAAQKSLSGETALEGRKPGEPKPAAPYGAEPSTEDQRQTKDRPQAPEALSAFEKYLLERSFDVRQFGYDLFNEPPSTFAPVETVPVSPDYLLGPGDELNVSIWGRISADHTLLIGREGDVNFPLTGVIHLAGLTFAEAKAALEKELSRNYNLSEVKMNVRMGRLRTMRVFVVGRVARPGSYTLSSLSTLINALFAAGGPSKIGSMRDIQVKRNGSTVVHFDLYDFLLKGDKSKDVRLMPEDVVFVPPAGPLAAIGGEVRAPGVYELKGEVTVNGLIEMAGGLNDTAFNGRVRINRIIDGRETALEASLKGMELSSRVSPGDVIRIFPISEDINIVRLSGAVQRPGEYGLGEAGLTVKELIALSGGLKYFAYADEAELTRVSITSSGPVTEKIKVALKKALEDDPGSNIRLKRDDYLFVRTVPEWHLYSTVSIKGEVRFPGDYTIKKGETLSSLIERAGGFTGKAYLKGAVFTRESVRELQQKQLDESIDRLEHTAMASSVEMIEASLDPNAAKQEQAALAQRKALIAKLRAAKAKGRISIRLEPMERFKGSPSDIVLEEGDVLQVPDTPAQVQVIGSVYNQTAFIYSKDSTVGGYIRKAGGLTSQADEKEIYVLKVDGTALGKGDSSWSSDGDGGSGRWFKGSFMSSRLDPGDTVVVPEKLDTISWMREVKDITQILYQIAVTAGVLIVAF